MNPIQETDNWNCGKCGCNFKSKKDAEICCTAQTEHSKAQKGNLYEPFALKDDSGAVRIYACSKCRIVHKTKMNAMLFCSTHICCDCGADTKHVILPLYEADIHEKLQCNKCRQAVWDKKSAEKEKSKFNKATKITLKDYQGKYLLSPINDERFIDKDELPEEIESALQDNADPNKMPRYTWAAGEFRPSVSVNSIIDHVLDSTSEDVEDAEDVCCYPTEEEKAVMQGWLDRFSCVIREVHPPVAVTFDDLIEEIVKDILDEEATTTDKVSREISADVLAEENGYSFVCGVPALRQYLRDQNQYMKEKKINETDPTQK